MKKLQRLSIIMLSIITLAFPFSILADTKNIPHNTKISLQYGTAEASCLDSIGSYWLFGKAYNTNNYLGKTVNLVLISVLIGIQKKLIHTHILPLQD